MDLENDAVRANFLRRPRHTEDGAVDLSIKYVPEYACLTVELFQAFALHCESKVCNPYVEISLITDSNRTVAGTLNRTRIVPNTKYPMYRDRKRGEELYEIYSMLLDEYRDAARLFIAVKNSPSLEYSEDDDLLGCFSFDLDQIGKYCGREWHLIFPKEIGVSMNLRSSDLPAVPRYMTLMTSPTSSMAALENTDHRSACFKSLIEKFMPLNNGLKTPDNRLVTPKIMSFKNQLAPPSVRKQLNFGKGSTMHGAECDTYEHLAIEPLDDQECYETLNIHLTTPDVRLMTSNTETGSIEQGTTEFVNYKQLSNSSLSDLGSYTVLNNQLKTPDDRLITPKIKSIKNQLATPSARKHCAPKSPRTGGNFKHSAATSLGDHTKHAPLNNQRTPSRFQPFNHRSLTPKINLLNIQNVTPTMSIASGSYCEIVTPFTENRLNFTSGAMSQSPQFDSMLEGCLAGNIRGNLSHAYGLFPKPRLNCTIGAKVQSSQPSPIEYGLFPKPSRKTKRSRQVERKTKPGLFSRAKKEKCLRTPRTDTKQVRREHDERNASQVVSSFKRGKLRSSLSKLKHRITQAKKSLEGHGTSPSPLKKHQHSCSEDLSQSYDKSSLGKSFLSKCRNRLQNLPLFQAH